MEPMTIVIAVAVVAVIGLLCAVMLTIASKFMAVEVDERIPMVRECLPGANCGACGFAGCDGYAAALVEDPDLAVSLCVPGGATAAESIGKVLGREAGDVAKQVAEVRCSGTCEATSVKMDYKGLESCAAAKLLFGGTGKCVYGCIGLGDCAQVCPVGAIHINGGLARVDASVCIGCGLCAKTCPNHVIAIRPPTPTWWWTATATRRARAPARAAPRAASAASCARRTATPGPSPSPTTWRPSTTPSATAAASALRCVRPGAWWR